MHTELLRTLATNFASQSVRCRPGDPGDLFIGSDCLSAHGFGGARHRTRFAGSPVPGGAAGLQAGLAAQHLRSAKAHPGPVSRPGPESAQGGLPRGLETGRYPGSTGDFDRRRGAICGAGVRGSQREPTPGRASRAAPAFEMSERARPQQSGPADGTNSTKLEIRRSRCIGAGPARGRQRRGGPVGTDGLLGAGCICQRGPGSASSGRGQRNRRLIFDGRRVQHSPFCSA